MSKANYDAQKLNRDEEIKKAEIAVRVAEDNSRSQLEAQKIASKEQIEGFKTGREVVEDLFDRESV
jgi:hypothetical protein